MGEFAGIAHDPDDVAMRQVPSLRLLWHYQTWVSPDGRVRNRYYDPRGATWVWGDVRASRVDARSGRVGYTIYGAFRTIEQVIALAWVPRDRPMLRMRAVHQASGVESLTARDITWADERCHLSDDDADEDMDEEFRPLRLKIGIVPCIRDDVLISRRGRIRLVASAPDQRRITRRGHASYGPSLLFPFENVGLLPLDLVGHMVCTGERLRSERPPPRVTRTIRLLKKGHDVAHIARELAILESTAWSYAHMAMRHVSTDTARALTLRLVSERLHHIVQTLADETSFVLHGRLKDVINLVNNVLVDDPDWRTSPSRYARVSLIRSLLQR